MSDTRRTAGRKINADVAAARNNIVLTAARFDVDGCVGVANDSNIAAVSECDIFSAGGVRGDGKDVAALVIESDGLSDGLIAVGESGFDYRS